MADRDPNRIVIVGAGECAARAVVALRDRRFEGSIELVGDEQLAPYERPPLSKSAIIADSEPLPVTVLSTERMAELDVSFRAGRTVTAVDRVGRTVVLDDASTLGFDRLLLATGAIARALTIPGGQHALTLRAYGDSLVLRKAFTPGVRVGVIGAGFIGLELAAGARQRGAIVTVLEAGPTAMGRAVPPEIADVLVKRHALEGVDLRFGVSIERIETFADGQRRIICDAATGDIDCDIVVAGIGARPNIDVAVGAGLNVANGIAVDEYLCTNDPDIFAAGDCCSFPHPLYGGRRIRLEAWRNALDQGACAAVNMLGAQQVYGAVPWFWSDQYDLGLQIAGLPDAAVTDIVRERSDGASVRFGLDSDGRIVSACGVAPGTTIGRDIRLAEMMIAARLKPSPVDLRDPSIKLKQLLSI